MSDKKRKNYSISIAERINRLQLVDQMILDGISDHDICDTLEISPAILKQSKKDLSELKALKISPEEIGSKRADLFFEYNEITEETKQLLEKTKLDGEIENSRKLLVLWKEIVEAKSNLFGVSVESAKTVVQNTNLIQHNSVPILPASHELDYAEIIKREHEKLMHQKYADNTEIKFIEKTEPKEIEFEEVLNG